MFKPGEVIVQKFGGSSMATPERILKVAERVAESTLSGRKAAVVVSAMGDTTDDLISLMHKVSHVYDSCEMDHLMATGEMVSSALMAAALSRLGRKAKSFNAFNLGIITDNQFGNAEIKKFAKIKNLVDFLNQDGIAVITGFQGVTESGDLTTLGRGGSDITAVAVARELGQKVCEKYTDEDGIYSADPRLIPSARKIWHLSYDEMATLAAYGNGILHPRAISYAKAADIRLHVRSSFSKNEGSIVGPLGAPEIKIKSLTCDRKQAMMIVSGLESPLPAEVFHYSNCGFQVMELQVSKVDGLFEYKIGFKISESFPALTFFWSEAEKWNARDLKFHSRLAVFSLVGCGLESDPMCESAIAVQLEKLPCEPILIEKKGNRLSVIVEESFFEPVLHHLHNILLSLQ